MIVEILKGNGLGYKVFYSVGVIDKLNIFSKEFDNFKYTDLIGKLMYDLLKLALFSIVNGDDDKWDRVYKRVKEIEVLLDKNLIKDLYDCLSTLYSDVRMLKADLVLNKDSISNKAEEFYVDTVIDGVIKNNNLNVVKLENGFIVCGKFKKKYNKVLVNYIFDRLKNYSGVINIEKKEAGVDFDLERSVVFISDNLSNVVDKNVLADIIENADSAVDESDRLYIVKKFNLEFLDEQYVNILANLYINSIKKSGCDIFYIDKVFRDLFCKSGGETYLEKEDDNIVAVVEDTGRVVLKDKMTGVEREEKIYKSKEEALTDLGASGYK